jgi:cardiolipin synthase A/B
MKRLEMIMSESMYNIYHLSRDAWDAMYESIEKAKKSVYWEQYIFVDDSAGQRFFDLLEKKAKDGVDVKVIVDSMGSYGLSNRTIKKLKKAGVDIRFFRERKRKYRGIFTRLGSRTHRKILIVDEEIGFIGGVNVHASMKDWLDIHIRIIGTPVHSMLRAFAKMYVICGGKRKDVKHLLKYKFRLKQDMIDFVYDEYGGNKSNARKKYMEALLKARERVILFSPYYFPDKKFLYGLWRARKRGVKVDLLIPFRTDVRLATYAGYAWFSLLQKLGVRVHLMDKMMHGKGVVVDDDWAMIGSSNLEQGSFYDHYEANVQVRDKVFVATLKEIVQDWMSKAKKLEDINWEKRGRLHKSKEWIALKLYGLWHKRASNFDFTFRPFKKKRKKKKRHD